MWKEIKCSEKINQKERETIFSQYWELANIDRQREFINCHVEIVKPKYQYKVVNSFKSNNLHYFFNVEIETSRIRVCKLFFKSTLNINDTNISTARKKLNESGSTEKDKRGKHTNRNAISEEDKNVVRNHINLFPRIESHYLRSHTTREFIDGSLSLSEMYRMYTEYCKNHNIITPVKKHCYEHVFNYEFNIGFFSPEKDQCSVCEEYKNTSSKTPELEDIYKKTYKK